MEFVRAGELIGRVGMTSLNEPTMLDRYGVASSRSNAASPSL